MFFIDLKYFTWGIQGAFYKWSVTVSYFTHYFINSLDLDSSLICVKAYRQLELTIQYNRTKKHNITLKSFAILLH